MDAARVLVGIAILVVSAALASLSFAIFCAWVVEQHRKTKRARINEQVRAFRKEINNYEKEMSNNV